MGIPSHYLGRSVKCEHCSAEFIAPDQDPAVGTAARTPEAKSVSGASRWVLVGLILGAVCLAFVAGRHFQAKKQERYSAELLRLMIQPTTPQGTSFDAAVSNLETRYFGQPLAWTERKDILDNYWTDSKWMSNRTSGWDLTIDYGIDMPSAAPSRILFPRNRIASVYDPNSLANPYGAGSPYLADGLMNSYSRYGSKYSNNSWRNPYATDAPKLYGSDGRYLGRFSTNQYDPDSISNPYGRYGNPYSSDSVNNLFGAGNPYRTDPIYVVPQE